MSSTPNLPPYYGRPIDTPVEHRWAGEVAPTTTHYVVGRNLAGYMPESDVVCFTDWQDAADYLASEMRDYADRDDQAADEWIAATVPPDEISEDDQPRMSATVGAILTDDGPREVGKPWGAIVNDNDDRPISFWLQLIPADQCEADHDED